MLRSYVINFEVVVFGAGGPGYVGPITPANGDGHCRPTGRSSLGFGLPTRGKGREASPILQSAHVLPLSPR
jgi:hypothetical protein